jgi:hypothetical protein
VVELEGGGGESLPPSPTGVNGFTVVALGGGWYDGRLLLPLAARRMHIAASVAVRRLAVWITLAA